MGVHTIKPFIQVLAWLITAVLVYLNLRMLVGQTVNYFAESDNLFWKIAIVIGGLIFLVLLVTTIFYPLIKRKPSNITAQVHEVNQLSLSQYMIRRTGINIIFRFRHYTRYYRIFMNIIKFTIRKILTIAFFRMAMIYPYLLLFIIRINSPIMIKLVYHPCLPAGRYGLLRSASLSIMHHFMVSKFFKIRDNITQRFLPLIVSSCYQGNVIAHNDISI